MAEWSANAEGVGGSVKVFTPDIAKLSGFLPKVPAGGKGKAEKDPVKQVLIEVISLSPYINPIDKISLIRQLNK